MSSRKLQAIIKTQYNFINNLLDRLEGKTKSNDTETEKTYKIGNKKYSWYEIITLLGDNYFNGLNLEQILELAKKSIRITTYNRELENKIELLDEKINALLENCKMFQGENEEYIKIDEVLSILEGK